MEYLLTSDGSGETGNGSSDGVALPMAPLGALVELGQRSNQGVRHVQGETKTGKLTREGGVGHVHATRVIALSRFADDFYSNLLDWAGPNIYYAVKKRIYAYNYHTEESAEIFRTPCNVTSLKFNSACGVLVAGTSSGALFQVGEKSHCDEAENKRLCPVATKWSQGADFFGDFFVAQDEMATPHRSRIGVMDAVDSLVVTGSRDRKVKVFDLRTNSVELVFAAHTQEVCGLSISGHRVASGGNDNRVCVFDLRNSCRSLFRFTDHRAAVKAVCLDRNVLYSGGGSADKTVKKYDLGCPGGRLIQSAQFGSQVTNIQTILYQNEPSLICTFGYSDDDAKLVSVANNKFRVVQQFVGHRNRVIHFAMSDDRKHFVTGSGDATIRVWDVNDERDELRIR